ncbi:hypothetical protein TSUD_44510 [Trifolium subterraneum]|nr:hypothetical protein TSUD_44510 [Trifolium subterraneum]
MERYYKCVALLVLVEITQICLCANSNVPCIEQERQALLEFKSSIAPDSPNNLSSWKGTHCCQWEGIGCDNVTGHVVKLDLNDACTNHFSREKELLTALAQMQGIRALFTIWKIISLISHVCHYLLQIWSPIPMFIGSMGRLEYLSLCESRFRGRIPDSLRNLKNLHFLDLSFNFIDLQINNDINWIARLHSLKYLDLSFVHFNETHNLFQVLNTLPSLLHLSLRGCEIDNSLIPRYAFQNMTSLVYLDLSWNELHGPIPVGFRNLSSIEYLFLSSNNFTSIPSCNDVESSLTVLDLSYNMLHGQIPHAFMNLTSLAHLDLFGNYLDSVSSMLIGNGLKKLVYLDIGNNELYGPIPEVFRNMTSIESLYLYYNNFTSVPSWFCNFEKLTHLDLSFNGLHGPIPDAFRNMHSIESLVLSENSLTSIPSWLVEFKRLVSLDLSGNQLTHTEYISSNKLDGIKFMEKGWPSIMPYLNLWYLDLSHNQISGSLPKDISHILPSLGDLFLGSNLLNGSIPISLCQNKIYRLDLSNNNLSGEIPNCWENNQGLYEINLSSNNNSLSSLFPSTFGILSSLFWLHLNNNSLQGELPTSLINLKQLLILDLGENQLSGNIPSSWTTNTFPSLQILRLRKNKLSGSIPSQICQFKLLEVLDLSLNKLEGSIPRCIGNLQGMTLGKSSYKVNGKQPHKLIAKAPSPVSTNFPAPPAQWSNQDVTEVMKGMELEYTKILKLVVNMDLSQNNLVGFIPNEITWLTGLHGLNLSKNQLKGEIPQMIGDMKSLESLDMSHNHLSGTIPNSMPDLTSLGHLNLSHNNLSGPIHNHLNL